ncbi:MAG TPA: hypothetical protein PKH07_00535 [bacterium]|nr:hypothetical protein [bacterium]
MAGSCGSDYKVAGFLSPVGAVLGLSGFFVCFSPAPDIFSIPFFFFAAIIEIYVYLRFKDFLNRHYDFSRVNKLIAFLIIFCVLDFTLGVLDSLIPDSKGELALTGTLAFAILIPGGIAQIMFCRRLLRLNGTLHGLLKPFAYTGMVIAIALLSVVFVLVGIFLTPVYSTLLGIILIKGPEQAEIPEFV